MMGHKILILILILLGAYFTETNHHCEIDLYVDLMEYTVCTTDKIYIHLMAHHVGFCMTSTLLYC